MTAKTLIEELVETIDKLPGTIGGKWKLGYTGSDIGCENEKIGGFAKLLDIRGWGYLTGTGHGALGLSQDEGAVVQRLYSQHVVNCSPDNIRTIAAYVRRLEEERDDLAAKRGAGLDASATLHDALMAARSSIHQLEAERDELRRAVEWQPIETAPANWTDILLCDPEFRSDHRKVFEGYFDADMEVWVAASGEPVSPTHWMPLPPAPLALNPERAEGGE